MRLAEGLGECLSDGLFWGCEGAVVSWQIGKSAGEFAGKVLEDFSSSVPASCWSLAISYLLFCSVIVGISFISTPLDPGQCSQRCHGRDPEEDHSQDVRPKMPVVCFWPWKIWQCWKKEKTQLDATCISHGVGLKKGGREAIILMELDWMQDNASLNLSGWITVSMQEAKKQQTWIRSSDRAMVANAEGYHNAWLLQMMRPFVATAWKGRA